MQLLLVEDDLPLAEAICDGVRQLQWQIEHVADAEAAKLDARALSLGERVTLSVCEYRTLLALFERQKRVVTRDQLQQLVYDDDSEIGSNTMAVFIHQ